MGRELGAGLSRNGHFQWPRASHRLQPVVDLDTSLPLEQQARKAFELRNTFRTTAREIMEDREKAEFLTRAEPNYTWEEIVAKYRSQGLQGDDLWRKIIQGSQKSRPSVNNDLGL